MKLRTPALFVALVLAPSIAYAFSWAPGQIPNGGQNSCSNCHVNPRGGGSRTDFGQLVRSSGAMNLSGRTIDWSLLFAADSDGDGYTNGEELGDPDGDRTTIPGWRATLPGDESSTPCGNGSIEGPEECDGTALEGATCESLGQPAGRLGCSSSCEFDTSECTGTVEEEDAGGGEDAGGESDAGGDTDAGGEEDAGGVTDAGEESDSGEPVDAGPVDGGSGDGSVGGDTTVEPGPDAGGGAEPTEDAGSLSDTAGGPGPGPGGADAGSGGSEEETGDSDSDSGCSAVAGGGGSTTLLWAGAAALMLARTRRRKGA